MKNKVMIAAVLAAALGLTGCSDIAESIKEKLRPSETAVTETTVTETSAVSETSADMEASAAETSVSDEYDETGGGNGGEYSEKDITVSENRYFYDNREVTFEEIQELFADADANTAVNIYDEQASDSAFTRLTDFLDEKGIGYEVK